MGFASLYLSFELVDQSRFTSPILPRYGRFIPVRDGADHVPGVTLTCHHGWCREYAMRNIADLLMRFWPGSQPAANTEVADMAENRDRSSMADFVRILQTYDQAQWGGS